MALELQSSSGSTPFARTVTRLVWSGCVLIGGLVTIGCGGGDDADGTKPGGGYTTAGLRDAAHQLYTARDNREDLRPYVSAITNAYGVSISSASDGPALAAELATGSPLLLPPQIDDLAIAFDDGVLVSLDSFVAEMDLRGATVEATGAPLSADFLGELASSLLAKPELGPDETLLAFVLALGQERATRLGTGIDPVWGDRALDPIQFVLLLDAVLYSGADHPVSGPASVAPGSKAQSAGAVAGEVGGYLEGLAEQQLEIPITTESAAETSLCASLILYGYKTTLTVVPNPIWHHQLDGNVAWTTQVTATMDFQDDYWNNYYGPKKDIIDAAGCKLPKQGPVDDGLKVEWDASEPLSKHGSFDIAGATTKDGKAMATFRAVEETTPAKKRLFENQRDAVGAVKIQASGALPGWSTLEWFVTNLKETGTSDTANLTILYYIDPCLPTALEGGLAELQCTPTWTGTSKVTQFIGATITGQIAFVNGVSADGVVTYSASGTITYEQPGCTFAPSSYTLSPEDGELVLDYGTNPPTYSGAGYAQWLSTVDCGSGPSSTPASIGGIWFSVPGDPTNPFQVSADGLKMEGTASDFSGSVATWSLTQTAP